MKTHGKVSQTEKYPRGEFISKNNLGLDIKTINELVSNGTMSREEGILTLSGFISNIPDLDSLTSYISLEENIQNRFVLAIKKAKDFARLPNKTLEDVKLFLNTEIRDSGADPYKIFDTIIFLGEKEWHSSHSIDKGKANNVKPDTYTRTRYRRAFERLRRNTYLESDVSQIIENISFLIRDLKRQNFSTLELEIIQNSFQGLLDGKTFKLFGEEGLPNDFNLSRLFDDVAKYFFRPGNVSSESSPKLDAMILYQIRKSETFDELKYFVSLIPSKLILPLGFAKPFTLEDTIQAIDTFSKSRYISDSLFITPHWGIRDSAIRLRRASKDGNDLFFTPGFSKNSSIDQEHLRLDSEFSQITNLNDLINVINNPINKPILESRGLSQRSILQSIKDWRENPDSSTNHLLITQMFGIREKVLKFIPPTWLNPRLSYTPSREPSPKPAPESESKPSHDYFPSYDKRFDSYERPQVLSNISSARSPEQLIAAIKATRGDWSVSSNNQRFDFSKNEVIQSLNVFFKSKHLADSIFITPVFGIREAAVRIKKANSSSLEELNEPEYSSIENKIIGAKDLRSLSSIVLDSKNKSYFESRGLQPRDLVDSINNYNKKRYKDNLYLITQIFGIRRKVSELVPLYSK